MLMVDLESSGAVTIRRTCDIGASASVERDALECECHAQHCSAALHNDDVQISYIHRERRVHDLRVVTGFVYWSWKACCSVQLNKLSTFDKHLLC